MNNRVYVFIDASNLWEAQKKKSKLFDFVKLKSYLQTQFYASVLEIFYYTSFPEKHTRTYSLQNKHNFFVFLKKTLKYNVIKKEIIVDIIDKLLKKLLFYLKDCLYKNMVDKIIENLFILYKKEWVKDISINENNIIVKMNTTKLIKCIVENININIYPGISNKSKSYFKLIDILEK
jgi:hypothetical protein